jgi:hypothetical protein
MKAGRLLLSGNRGHDQGISDQREPAVGGGSD